MITPNYIKDWILKHKQALINHAMELISIRSVSEKCEGLYPFGQGCARVLDRALAISTTKGLEIQNHAHYCGSALLKGETAREIGIFTHLDIVHEGTGWQSDPYQPYIQGDWLFGRGSADNKGAAMCALYALSFLREHNVPLKHTLRLFFGCDEERSMEDIAYYKANYPLPAFSLVPDAAFPVCYAEKGIIEAEFSTPLQANIVDFSAGIAANSVPAAASITLAAVSLEEAGSFLKAEGEFTIQEQNSGIKVTAFGLAAHAAFPTGSENAAVKLAQALCKAPFVTADAKASLRFIGETFADYYGEAMGIACADKASGQLTVIGGKVYVKQNRLVQNINVRYPISADQRELLTKICACGQQYGWQLDWIRNNPPHYFDPQSPIVTTLTNICHEVLPINLAPYAMGGGTYARKLSKAVGYGPGVPNLVRPCPPGHGGGHQPDECVNIDALLKATEIYIRAIIELDRFDL